MLCFFCLFLQCSFTLLSTTSATPQFLSVTPQFHSGILQSLHNPTTPQSSSGALQCCSAFPPICTAVRPYLMSTMDRLRTRTGLPASTLEPASRVVEVTQKLQILRLISAHPASPSTRSPPFLSQGPTLRATQSSSPNMLAPPTVGYSTEDPSLPTKVEQEKIVALERAPCATPERCRFRFQKWPTFITSHLLHLHPLHSPNSPPKMRKSGPARIPSVHQGHWACFLRQLPAVSWGARLPAQPSPSLRGLTTSAAILNRGTCLQSMLSPGLQSMWVTPKPFANFSKALRKSTNNKTNVWYYLP